MKTYKFRTNINCGGCVATVKPHLDKAEGVEAWEVDTTHKDKILTVKTAEDVPEENIQKVVKTAGFHADPVKAGFFEKLFRN
jgi:copper chaperone CopZ